MTKYKILKILGKWGIILAQSFIITGITVLSVAPVSCKATTSGIEIVGGDYSAPVLQNVNVLNEKTVEIDFSEEVELMSYVVSPVLPDISNSDIHSDSKKLSPSIFAATGGYGKIDCNVESSENKQILTFNFSEGTEVGKQYEILGVVKDRIGNSLTFSVPFTGYNNHFPEIIMTELHTSMAGQIEKEKEMNIRRLEYIQFLALTDGNLVGLEVCSGLYGESKKYCFPSVEVKAGDYFVLHLRKWGEGCISEEGDALDLAFSEYTDDSVRDLWLDNTTRFIGDKTDVVVLRNGISGKIVDAVMYRDNSVEEWSEKLKSDFTKEESFADIYVTGVDVDNAVDGSKLTASYVVQRVERENLRDAVFMNEEISYPIQVDFDSWTISKPSLPLKQ